MPDHDEIAYQELGTGRTLLLLHGFFGSGSQLIEYGPAAAIAERGYRVILPDLRGHGASAKTHDPAAYPPDAPADDGLRLVERLGLDDYDLGGYSFGGRIVVRMLIRGARPRRAIVAGQGLDQLVKADNRDGPNWHVLTAMINGTPLTPGSPEAGLADWITKSGADPVTLRHVLNTHVPTTTAELSKITIPTLVAIGAEDSRQHTAGALATSMSNARLVQVPGDHFAAMGRPELATAIVEFLDK